MLKNNISKDTRDTPKTGLGQEVETPDIWTETESHLSIMGLKVQQEEEPIKESYNSTNSFNHESLLAQIGLSNTVAPKKFEAA